VNEVATYQGTIVKSDLEGGSWLLKGDNGVMYQLRGVDEQLLKDGQRVVIEGRIATQIVGIAMVGDVIQVSSYRVL
jgi:hypothetical protein